ncbi:MarR family transcriptional regulator [Streptomyces sp. SL13]|jgi:DNA-binding MarR family transcriptional regulator|uniref:MarR family transcriptional regulator n=1 Tax=Streptantibioticus silvisoli TaxID=2705255 RepID=A0AA90H4G0_9ACTN|nr:MarR family transcriptional regulator [Streptantibioticus silvisoli]MDI5967382.1 MarR family transcriptional regulator [Streptantibioticus silvisoli]MDI5973938.1 MarR family transcriptional regulator [Streptantibioticus silvisoli]
MTDADRSRLAEELTAVVGQLGRRMRAASPQGALTASQRIALGHLMEGPATTAALARAEHVRPQSMRATLAALEEQDLIVRSPDPADGRQVVCALSDTGVRRLASLREAKRTWLTETVEAVLTPGEQETLAEAVTLLRRLVES